MVQRRQRSSEMHPTNLRDSGSRKISPFGWRSFGTGHIIADPKGKGSGFNDLSLRHEWQHSCNLFRYTRVHIGLLDVHLSSHDRAAELP